MKKRITITLDVEIDELTLDELGSHGSLSRIREEVNAFIEDFEGLLLNNQDVGVTTLAQNYTIENIQ